MRYMKQGFQFIFFLNLKTMNKGKLKKQKKLKIQIL